MKTRLKIALLQIVVLALILIGWQAIPYFHIVNPFIMPPFTVVARTLPSLFNSSNPIVAGGLGAQLSVTLLEIAVAFVLSISIGIPLGFVFGYNKLLGKAFEPLVYLIYAVPAIIIYPIMFLSLGVGEISKIALGTWLGVFPLLVNTIAGFREMSPNYMKLARSLGLQQTKTLAKIVVPAVAPSIMSGARISLAHVMIGVIAGEVLASQAGLGFTIVEASDTFHAPIEFATIIVVFVISAVFVFSIQVVEKRLFAHSEI